MGYDDHKAVPGAWCYTCDLPREVKDITKDGATCAECGAHIDRDLVCIPKANVGGIRDAWARARWRQVKPTVEPDGRDGTVERHPAYGMIGVSRVSGTGHVLAGSDFRHQNFMTVYIKRAAQRRSLSRDWWMGDDEIVEVELSESQWATFVSSPNIGDGVPCTIAHVERSPMPSLPSPEPKSNTFKGELVDRLKDGLALLNEALAEMEAGKGGNKSVRDKVKSALARLTDGAPWVAQQFGEHMEEIIEDVKVEVNAYMNAVIQRAGLEALGTVKPPLALHEGPADEGDPIREATDAAKEERRHGGPR